MNPLSQHLADTLKEFDVLYSPEAGNSKGQFERHERRKKFLESALRTQLEIVREELGKLKVITPAVEPPKNTLSQNQIFASGQMNMLIRANDILSSLEDSPSKKE